MSFGRRRSFSTNRFRGKRAFRGRRPLGSVAAGSRITRVQRANFWLSQDLNVPESTVPPASLNIAFEIAKILDHVADFTAGDGVVMASMVKSIDISSIVFDYGWQLGHSVISAQFDPVVNSYLALHTALCVDRLDASGVPVAVATWQPFEVQPIVSAVGGGLPATTTLEAGFPTRILWREHDCRNQGVATIVDTDGDLYFPYQTAVTPLRSGRVHKRLRLRLDDEHGLYICASASNYNNNNSAPNSIRFWAGGAIYYKVNI